MKLEQFKLSEKQLDIIAAIQGAGMQPLLVGGCVRDLILGFTPKDIDVEVHGAVSYEAILEALTPFGKADVFGKSFGVIKIGDMDISLPRRDSKIGEGHRGFQIEVDPMMSLEEASSRRDFTINSIMFDTRDEVIIDPHGGIEDIANKTLKHTSEAFSDDPLRVLRGVQFACRFNFTMDVATARLCQSLKSEYASLASERVWTEFEKMLMKGTSFNAAFRVLRSTGWIEFFPELDKSEGFKASQVARRCSEEKVKPEVRMACILASVAADNNRQVLSCAPEGIRSMAKKLVETRQNELDTRMTVKSTARFLAPLTIRDLARAFVLDFPTIAQEAKVAGVLDGPEKPFLDGFMVMERGHKGAEIGRILSEVLFLQDVGLVNSLEQALSELDRA